MGNTVSRQDILIEPCLTVLADKGRGYLVAGDAEVDHSCAEIAVAIGKQLLREKIGVTSVEVHRLIRRRALVAIGNGIPEGGNDRRLPPRHIDAAEKKP